MLRPLPLSFYVAAMQPKGLSVVSILAGTSIDASRLSNADYRVDIQDYHRAINNIINLAGAEGVGCDIGLAATLPDFGILGHAAISSGSIRQSMLEFGGPYGNCMGMTTRFSFPGDQMAEPHASTAEIVGPRVSDAVFRFGVEEALCLLINLGKEMTGQPARLKKIEFSYPKPAYVDRYHELFDCPLTFSCPRTRVTLDHDWVDYPLKTRNAEVNQLYQQHLAQVKRQIEDTSSVVGRTRSIMLRGGGSFPESDAIAREMGISSRTLRHLLRESGTSYRNLVQEARLELARRWLSTTRSNAKEISHQLGFEDVNAFRNAFRRWTGRTLGEYQKELLGPRATNKMGYCDSDERETRIPRSKETH